MGDGRTRGATRGYTDLLSLFDSELDLCACLTGRPTQGELVGPLLPTAAPAAEEENDIDEEEAGAPAADDMVKAKKSE